MYVSIDASEDIFQVCLLWLFIDGEFYCDDATKQFFKRLYLAIDNIHISYLYILQYIDIYSIYYRFELVITIIMFRFNIQDNWIQKLLK